MSNLFKNSVSLQKLTREHIEDFFVWASDPEVAKYMTWDAYKTKEEGLTFLINVAESHPYFKAIVFEGRVVGSITLSPEGNKAELGYVLARQFWGRGIATAAVKIALKEGISQLHLQRIEAFVDPDNTASQRVLEKAGMKNEGLLKNFMIFKGQVKDRFIYGLPERK